MRAKERIPVVLNNINWRDFIEYLGFDDYNDIVNECEENIDIIIEYWEKSPDLRLTQVLLNLDILYNKPGFWYNEEEIDYLIKNNVVKPENILFWGTYGKDGKQPFKQISINDMTSGHIEACLDTQKRINLLYKKTMINVLRRRKLKTVK